jgi:rod shape-determining protein MreC
MSGLNEQQGKLQYVKNEKFKTNDNVELTVLTSGSGGVFKSGIPIGTIDSLDTLDNNKILVNFYENFSQLKYVRISSHIKENINLDKSNKKIFKANTNQIVKINNQAEDIKVLQQQKIIDEEIRNKFEKENTILKKELIKAQEDLKKEKINQVNLDDEELIFLKKNLLYGHRCRKTFFKSTLYKINTPKYRNCVLNKGVLKN